MDITPILTPFVALLKSRAFILSVVSALVASIIAAVPALEPMQDELINVIVGLTLALIGKMAVEDGAEKLGASRANTGRLEGISSSVGHAAESVDRSLPYR